MKAAKSNQHLLEENLLVISFIIAPLRVHDFCVVLLFPVLFFSLSISLLSSSVLSLSFLSLTIFQSTLCY